jgi:YHS domain-containing protein
MDTLLYFLIWGALIFLMMRFGCGAHVMGHGHGHEDSHAQGRGSPSGGNIRWTPPEKDVDPVCGMTIGTANAKSAVHEGHVYYFCSQDCREKFEAAPASYLKSPANASHVMEHHHGS